MSSIPWAFVLYHVTSAALLVLLVQSLNLIWKSGAISLGHHGYVAIGAYSAALFLHLLNLSLDSGTVSFASVRLAIFAAVLACGALAGGVAGQLTGRLFARLQGDYFSVATLVFAEIVLSFVANLQVLGGGRGFEIPPGLVPDDTATSAPPLAFAALAIALNLAFYGMLWRLNRTKLGLALIAANDDALAAELTGVHVVALRRTVYLLGTMVAGGTGALFLLFHRLIVPDDFSLLNGLPLIVCVILGRSGTARCVAATLLFYGSYELIKLRLLGLLGHEIGYSIGQWKEALLALLLVFSVVGPALTTRGRQTNRLPLRN